MRFVFCLILLFALSVRGQLIQSNLVLYLDAGTGLDTVAGGFFTNWSDIAWSANTINPRNVTNIFRLAPDSIRPALAKKDYALRPIVRFPWAASSAMPTNVLECYTGTLTNLNSQRVTVYAVAALANLEAKRVYADTNWGFGLMEFAGATTYPRLSFTVRNATNLYQPCNPSVFVTANSGGGSVMRWNNQEEGAASVGSAALSGGRISSTALNSRLSGDIYAILVYDETHDATERQQMVNWLSSNYKLQTNFTRSVVCRGDSLTAGVGSSELQSWPYQMVQQMPELLVLNLGIGSLQIGTNGVASTMYTLDQQRIDPIYRSNVLNNYIFASAGVNDIIAAGMSGENTYRRMTNWIGNRTSVWSIVVGTIATASGSGAAISNYNSALRTNSLPDVFGIATRLVDGGSGGRETRLNNSADTTYFSSDALHLTNNGYAVMSEYFRQSINQHRRGAFFGQ